MPPRTTAPLRPPSPRRWGLLAAGLLACLALTVAASLSPIGRQATRGPREAGQRTDDSGRAAVASRPTGQQRNAEFDSPATPNPPLLVEPPGPAPSGMVWIPGGVFRMGSPPPSPGNPLRIKPDELPAHDVELDGFWMDEHEVTNRQFQEFVDAAGYVTAAEQELTPEELARSGMPISAFEGRTFEPGSLCFNPDFSREGLRTDLPLWEYQVWEFVPGANWRHPRGPESSFADRLDHPVVHVSWEDAQAYCQWAGKQLPTEAQWEYAARGGRAEQLYPWGDVRDLDGVWQCNYWQGVFPTERLTQDGFELTAPVRSFPPNGYGLYDMAGNVWEWCADYFHAGYYAVSPRRNPPGPDESFDPREPQIIKRVTRGGSFMCNVNSCTGYRCAARMAAEFTSGTFHTGFRCVRNPQANPAAP